MAIYQVGADGKAPKGLKAGDTVVTGGGTYKINSVNSDGSYNSSLASKSVTTSNYTGGYANSPTTSSGSSSGSKSSGSSSINSQYTTGNYSKYASTGGDMGLYAQQLMDSGASAEDVFAVYRDRAKKISENSSLSQYEDDEIQSAMMSYILNASKSSSQEEYQENWEDMFTEEAPVYQNTYDPAITAMLDKILNRDDFSYDATKDPLYQQYVTQYRQEADRASKETLADAAASAGGMNSYAITAAQQANDYYNSQLAGKIPELYQLAYEMYLQDKASMVEDLGLLQHMDATQYNRYRDTMSDYYADKNFAYGLYQDAVGQGNFDKEFAYNQLINDRDYYHTIGRENIADSRYETEYSDAQKQYNDALTREDEEKAKSQAYEEAMALLQLGKMPSNDLLERAGMDTTTATLLYEGFKQQMSKEEALAWASKKTGSSSSGGTIGGYSDLEAILGGGNPEGDGGNLELDTRAVSKLQKEALVAKAAKETNSPNMTADALANMLKLGWIEYDDEEDKFKRTYNFGMNIDGAGFATLGVQ